MNTPVAKKTIIYGDSPEHVLQDILLRNFISFFEEKNNLTMLVADAQKACAYIQKQRHDFTFSEKKFVLVCQRVEKAVIARAESVGYPVKDAVDAFHQFASMLGKLSNDR